MLEEGKLVTGDEEEAINAKEVQKRMDSPGVGVTGAGVVGAGVIGAAGHRSFEAAPSSLCNIYKICRRFG